MLLDDFAPLTQQNSVVAVVGKLIGMLAYSCSLCEFLMAKASPLTLAAV